MSKGFAILMGLLFGGIAGAVAGYLVLASPVLFFGAAPEDMVLYGWITSLAGLVVGAFVALGVATLVARMLTSR
jgi:hypothetical protein